MNLIQAQEAAIQYEKLIASIPHDQLDLPHKSYSTQNWDASDIVGVTIEDGLIKVFWKRYSCGEAEHETSYENLEKFFS